MKRDSGIILKNYIRLHRRIHGMSRTDLGAIINRSTKNISMLEDGVAIPPLDIAWKLAQIFNVPIDELFYEEGNKVEMKLMLVRKESSPSPQ